ncbi:MAG: hypothetical protein FWC71_09300 [Defluviitaleaceae bacterium]|nr:hypothetical protein [Defluviitaleaceae bacterium]
MKKIIMMLGVIALVALGLTGCTNDDCNDDQDVTLVGNGSGADSSGNSDIVVIDDGDDDYEICNPPYFCALPDDYFCWLCDFDIDDIDLDGGFGFGGDDWEWVDPTGNPDEGLVALVTRLHENFEADFVPMRFDMELTAYNFERYLMIDYIEGVRGVISEAVINVHPHVVVLMEVADGMDASAIAAQIEAAADPTRWICVHAEAFDVVAHGNYIVFVMSWQDVVDGVVGNVPVILG